MSHGAGRARLRLTPPTALSPTQLMTEREILIKAVDRAVAQGWLGIRDQGYRYDGVVLHQGTVRVNASRLDSKSWLFNHPDRMLLSEEFAEAFFGSDPPPMDRSGPLRPMLGGIRVHRHQSAAGSTTWTNCCWRLNPSNI